MLIDYNLTLMLKISVLCLLVSLLAAIEIRVLANDPPLYSNSEKEIHPLKLSINSNGKYIYASQNQGSLATFKLYLFFKLDHNFPSEEILFKLFQLIVYILFS